MRRIRIEHVTAYDFGAEVQLRPHRLLLRPRESHSIRITASILEITPSPIIRWQRDVYDNSVALVSFGGSARTLRITSIVDLEHYEEAPLDFFVDDEALTYPFAYGATEQRELEPLCTMLWPDQRADVQRWLSGLALPREGEQTFALLDRLNRAIAAEFRYQARTQEGVQPPACTLALRSGSCRDFATLFMEACHSLGLATRFVSGYHTTLFAGEAGSTHAWAEVYVPGPGWKGFDPTAGLVTGPEHIAVAVARHPERVPPVAGSFHGASGSRPAMSVSVRVHEAAPDQALDSAAPPMRSSQP